MKVSHWYHWATGLVFFILGIVLLWIQPTVAVLPVFMSIALQKSLGWVLLAWSGFRGFHGYLVWKKSKLQQKDDE